MQFQEYVSNIYLLLQNSLAQEYLKFLNTADK